MPELKPCPLCKGTPHLIYKLPKKKANVRFCFVACIKTYKCLSKTKTSLFLKPEKAVEMWNTRSENPNLWR